jgi:hypothetical protein
LKPCQFLLQVFLFLKQCTHATVLSPTVSPTRQDDCCPKAVNKPLPASPSDLLPTLTK